MFGMAIEQAKGLFFDSKKVIDATTKAERRVFSRFGAFVRRAARSSIRKRKRASEPSKPPSSHTGLLKRFIFFVYDPNRRSVLIGPARLSGKAGDAPRALEHGGKSKIVARHKGRPAIRAVTIRARPFMGPAFEKEKPKLPAMWRDSVRA